MEELLYDVLTPDEIARTEVVNKTISYLTVEELNSLYDCIEIKYPMYDCVINNGIEVYYELFSRIQYGNK